MFKGQGFGGERETWLSLVYPAQLGSCCRMPLKHVSHPGEQWKDLSVSTVLSLERHP